MTIGASFHSFCCSCAVVGSLYVAHGIDIILNVLMLELAEKQ